jgi:hypothetical protein
VSKWGNGATYILFLRVYLIGDILPGSLRWSDPVLHTTMKFLYAMSDFSRTPGKIRDGYQKQEVTRPVPGRSDHYKHLFRSARAKNRDERRYYGLHNPRELKHAV